MRRPRAGSGGPARGVASGCSFALREAEARRLLERVAAQGARRLARGLRDLTLRGCLGRVPAAGPSTERGRDGGTPESRLKARGEGSGAGGAGVAVSRVPPPPRSRSGLRPALSAGPGRDWAGRGRAAPSLLRSETKPNQIKVLLDLLWQQLSGTLRPSLRRVLSRARSVLKPRKRVTEWAHPRFAGARHQRSLLRSRRIGSCDVKR